MVMLHMARHKTDNISSSDDNYLVQRIGGGSIVDRRPVFSPDGKLLYVVYGHVIRAYSTQTGVLVRDYKGLSHPAVGVQLHATRPELVVAVSEVGELMAWRWESGIHMMTVKLRVAPECLKVTSFDLLPSDDGDCDVFATWQKKDTNRAEMSVFSSRGRHKIDLNFSFDNTTHSVAFAFGTHTDGRYVVAICKDKLYTIDFQRNKGNWFRVSGKRYLTCVACHPTELCVATGDNTGRVLIWRDIIDNPQPPSAVYHWHTLPVTDIVFSQSGTFFYSGGGEHTLVKWRLNTPNEKSFLPRLSAPICHLSVSKDNMIIAVSTQDNGIQLVDPQREITRTIQYFSWGVQSGDGPLFPAGLNLDRRTHSLVLNSRTGHIQFYDPSTHSLLYNLDITGQNYLTQERNTKIINTEVIRVALSTCGKWLSTVEFIDNGEMSVHVTLKFYNFVDSSQKYSLNTYISMPHQGRVHALQFQPNESQNDGLLAVTTGEDKRFRIWSFNKGKNSAWQCVCVGHYRDQPTRDAAFSTDGSVLGVSFGSSLTLWNPDSCSLKCSLSSASSSKASPILSIQFGNNDCCHLVVTGTAHGLIVWNILTLSIVWTVPLKLSILTKDPFSKFMAAFTTTNTLFVFSPNSSKPVFTYKNICSNGTQILSAIFVPRSQIHSGDTWQSRSKLYFIDSNQELLALQRAEEVADTSETGLEGLPEWTPGLTPFSSLIAKQSSSAAIVRGHRKHNQLGLPGRKELEELLAAPAHTMPPQHLLCAGLLGALLSRETSAEEADEEASLAEERQQKKKKDEDSSEDEEETTAAVSKQQQQTQQQPGPISTGSVDPELERSLERVLREPLDWAKALDKRAGITSAVRRAVEPLCGAQI
ncbi:WD repeat-containing protein 75 [Frankliniella fusca]|uniref:WD repeat-containing protein 75 n=1 Tax=Frankliniella fusca TaxID=407009 RepID=A0AAE1LA77_9NEOP|nr:WD repeat-containing protein 75 [Frankliniella fusca]